MRLIDADAFVENHRKWYCENCERRKNSKGKFVYEVGGVPCRACYIGDLIDDVDSDTTVDAVEVVRCGECRHYDHYCGSSIGSGVCSREKREMNPIVDCDWYCADGERREE